MFSEWSYPTAESEHLTGVGLCFSTGHEEFCVCLCVCRKVLYRLVVKASWGIQQILMHGLKMVSQYTYTNSQPASKALHVLSEMCQSYKDLLQMSKVHTGCACVCERECFHVYEINDGSTCHLNKLPAGSVSRTSHKCHANQNILESEHVLNVLLLAINISNKIVL